MPPQLSSCDYCYAHDGAIALVFPSEEVFRRSDKFAGGDKVDDELAEYAIWPGKNNVGKREPEWTLCSPVHPLCGCEMTNYDKGLEQQKEDWFANIPQEEMDKYISDPNYL